MHWHPRVPSRHSDMKHSLPSAKFYEVPTRSKLSTKGKGRATTKGAWESILNTGKRNDANSHRQGVDEPQEKPVPAPGDDDSIATFVQKMIADEA